MSFPLFNGTGILTSLQYINTTTSGLGVPIILILGIFPILLITFVIGAGVRRGLIGSTFICGLLSTFLWRADLLGTIWMFLFFIGCAVSLAFPAND